MIKGAAGNKGRQDTKGFKKPVSSLKILGKGKTRKKRK